MSVASEPEELCGVFRRDAPDLLSPYEAYISEACDESEIAPYSFAARVLLPLIWDLVREERPDDLRRIIDLLEPFAVASSTEAVGFFRASIAEDVAFQPVLLAAVEPLAGPGFSEHLQAMLS